MAGLCKFGTVEWMGEIVDDQNAPVLASRVSSDVDGSRSALVGLSKFKVTSLAAGLWPHNKIYSWQDSGNKISYSNGVNTHGGRANLPYLLSVQAEITSGEDISGYRALNKRVHPWDSLLGSASGFRWGSVLGKTFYRNVSTSNPTLEAKAGPTAPANSTLDYYTCVRNLIFLSVVELAVGMRAHSTVSTTNQRLLGTTTDPTATPTWNAGFTVAQSQNTVADYVTMWGMELIQLLGINLFYYGANAGGNANPIAGTDTATLGYNLTSGARTVLPSTLSLPVPEGGYFVGLMPWDQLVVGIVVPRKTDANSVNNPRAFGYLTLAAGPTGTLSFPNTELSHVEHAFAYLGGVALLGDTSSGLATSCKHLDSSGNVRDLAMPAANGSAAWGAVYGFVTGRALFVRMAYLDATDAGWIVLIDGAWSVYSPLQSLSTTTNAGYGGLSIAYGCSDAALDPNQRRIYDFYPSSHDTTKTNVARIFVPRNLLSDPLVTNTAEKKHYGNLYCQMVELDMGAEESNKVLLQQMYQGRWVDSNSSYGTAKWEVSKAGAAFSSTDATKTFTAAMSTSELSVGATAPLAFAFQTLTHRMTVTNGATAAGGSPEATALAITPNGLPYLETFIIRWPLEHLLTVACDPAYIKSEHTSWEVFVGKLQMVSNTSSSGRAAQEVQVGEYDLPGCLEGFSGHFKVPALKSGMVEASDPKKWPSVILRLFSVGAVT